MNRPCRVRVTGDAYRAVFYVPRGCVAFDDASARRAHAHAFPVGVEYIARAIRAISYPTGWNEGDDAPVEVVRDAEPSSFAANAHEIPVALYEIGRCDWPGATAASSDRGESHPLLRLKSTLTREINLSGFTAESLPVCGAGALPGGPPGSRKSPADVIVHWLGELAPRKREWAEHATVHAAHLQIGLPARLGDKPPPQKPGEFATATDVRVVVVNVGEISSTHRIRRHSSYEAVAVDLLRYLRGDGSSANYTLSADPAHEGPLEQLSMLGVGAAPLSVLVVRINNSAVFLYACGRQEDASKEYGAWLLCHKSECAPISQPEIGQMLGFTGFVSSHIAAALAEFFVKDQEGRSEDPERSRLRDISIVRTLLAGVKRSLAWQAISYDRGVFPMLYKQIGAARRPRWTLTSPDVDRAETGFESMFADILQVLRGRHENSLGCNPKNDLSCFDALIKQDVLEIPVQIERAVAHRTQWFMARSVAARNPEGDKPGDDPLGALPIGDDVLRGRLEATALEWLCEATSPRESSIPVVHIGDAELTDRREVEDYLAIHQAIRVYGESHEARPLNIAVFGSPGAGKSFAVNEVVKHIGKSGGERRFKIPPLTFNLGQFKSLDDLPAALHLVRNECLSSQIPIVFFDEFDSAFNGQPFGWLKFFLAPMQDGEFYHAGQTFKMGRAVFVFAGGVNRSFEELNGRMRNPGFCEAKGPDFISRLKAHLNVQGVNMPEGDTDQHRYILRRGILLRNIVTKRMGLRPDKGAVKLLHESVAKALLRVERFKHGVRSMEAIIRMCSFRHGEPIGPSDLPSMDQLEMHVDAIKLLQLVDGIGYRDQG